MTCSPAATGCSWWRAPSCWPQLVGCAPDPGAHEPRRPPRRGRGARDRGGATRGGVRCRHRADPGLPTGGATYTTTLLVYLIGYELPPRLTAADIALFWRWDVVFGTLATLAACWYLCAVRRLRRGGVPWPVGRAAFWLAGCLVLLVATSSGIGAYAAAVFSVHMGQHMLLATLVPVLLVVGDGLGLALACGAHARVVERRAAGFWPSPRSHSCWLSGTTPPPLADFRRTASCWPDSSPRLCRARPASTRSISAA